MWCGLRRRRPLWAVCSQIHRPARQVEAINLPNVLALVQVRIFVCVEACPQGRAPFSAPEFCRNSRTWSKKTRPFQTTEETTSPARANRISRRRFRCWTSAPGDALPRLLRYLSPGQKARDIRVGRADARGPKHGRRHDGCPDESLEANMLVLSCPRSDTVERTKIRTVPNGHCVDAGESRQEPK